jgi:hypothetical protein
MFWSSAVVDGLVRWLAAVPYMQAVNFVGDQSQIGQIVLCKLSAARQNSMSGEIIAIKGAA